MTVQRKSVMVEQFVIESTTCDKCGTVVHPDDYLESNMISIQHDCGYGSIFDDGRTVSVDLCENCLKEVLGPYLRLKWQDWAL